MTVATSEMIGEYNELFGQRKREILECGDGLSVSGTKYYVSNSGDDNNDGVTEQTAWKTLEKVSEAELVPGDGVFFKRGEIFRGCINAKSGVTYTAFGIGDKPRLYAGKQDLASEDFWELAYPDYNIWKCKKKQPDSGVLVFNDGEKHSYKLIPSYICGKFVCRDNAEKMFDICAEMKNNLDMYWHFDGKLTTVCPHPVGGDDFPVPDVNDAEGDLYLRCDEGNPGNVFRRIESAARCHMFRAVDTVDVTIDNLCIKYVGMHGVSAGGFVEGLTVTNCEFGWIGGCIQHYLGLDPNYPEGGRGTVTRFGNAVEVYGGCRNYNVSNNYIYQVYDAGITHQITTNTKIVMENITYCDNVIENCVYGIEYFLNQIDGERESCMNNVRMCRNFIRTSGYGWGQQRHNKNTPSAIKGWSYVNTARNFIISDNVFYECAYRLLHLVALQSESLPVMNGNTYVQRMGGKIGQYGENRISEPENITFDGNTENVITEVFGDKTAKVLCIG